jgi:uncharacterized Fe-S cluster-containing protein
MIKKIKKIKLPGLNCGLCGLKTCADLEKIIVKNPSEIKRCIRLIDANKQKIKETHFKNRGFLDVLGRPFDFILDADETDEGPIEIIHPFNSEIIKKLKVGNLVFGRPLAAGCPVSHCGRILEVDKKSNLLKWCVLGPLVIRRSNKRIKIVDIGSYAPVVFIGLIKERKIEPKVGMRYNFIPRKCMIQWRHSGLISSLNKVPQGYRARIEGIFLG